MSRELRSEKGRWDCKSLEEDAGFERLGALGVEELSAGRSQWLVTQEAEASPPAWLPCLVYCLVSFVSNTSEEVLKSGGG